MSEILNQDAPTLDQARVEAFAGALVGHINGAALALMCSIGHRTGLFDTMASLPPSSCESIAKAAGLHERYVREWLGSMVTGRIVEHAPEAGTFHLPPEHAACLTRAASPGNMGVTMQFLPLMGSVEDGIIECFENGGGLPYSAYPRFHEVMAEESAQTVVAALVDGILPLVPGLVERLEHGIDVLEVGCGRGAGLRLAARAFPKSQFLGIDISTDAIATADAEARKAGLENVRFVAFDAARLDVSEQYDLVLAFDAIHDQAHPRRVLSGIARALRPDGTFLMQDIAASSHLHENVDNPLAPFLYTVSTMHCMSVSLAAGGEGLGTCWGQQTARRLLADAGFVSVEVSQLPHDPMNDYFVAKKTHSPPA
jgi:SAM-dependent methyltransferase